MKAAIDQDRAGSAHRRIFWAILLLSVLLRVGAALVLGDKVVDLPGTNDQISYHSLALRVLGGHGFSFGEDWWPATPANAPTAHWSYLYTLYLVAVYALFGIHPLAARLIQAVIVGLLQPYLAYRLAQQVLVLPAAGRNDRSPVPAPARAAPLLAAAITALYGYFIYYAGCLMTEPFYITAVMAMLSLGITLAARLVPHRPVSSWFRPALALGLTLVVAVLLRQLILIFIPFLFLWLACHPARTRAWRPWWGALAVSVVALALAILPFTIYNRARFGHFVLLNTNAGFAFFWANHPIYGTHFEGILPPQAGTYQSLIPPELLSLDEAALDQALLKRGLQFIVDDPGRYVLLSLSRIPVYFKFWPDSASGTISNITRVGSFGIALPFMLYGLWAALRDRNDARKAGRQKMGLLALAASPLTFLLLFIVVYAGMHIFSWSLIRYRLPIDAVLVIFAAYGLADLWQRIAYGLRIGQPSATR